MLRNFFILVFSSVPFLFFAQDCGVLNSLDIPTSHTACRRDTLHLNINNPSLTYKWNDSTTHPYYIFPSSGRIDTLVWVEITDHSEKDCKDTFYIIIDTFPAPIIDKKEIIDTTLCLGDTLKLTKADVLHADRFDWRIAEIPGLLQENIDELNVIFDTTKINYSRVHYVVTYVRNVCPNDYYWLSVYNVRDTVASIFFAKPPIVDLGLDTALCSGEHVLRALNPSDFDIPEYKFQWNDDENHNQNTFTVSYDNQGMHFVEVWNEFCRTKSPEDSIRYTAVDTIYNVTFFPPEWVNAHQLIGDTTIPKDTRITLDASAEDPTGMTTYHWEDDTTLVSAIRTVSVGSYTVTLKDSAGCEQHYSITVAEWKKEDCEKSSNIAMPNVFTPNGDGINDDFLPISFSEIHNFRIKIYNRWGRPAYSFEHKGNLSDATWTGWNGKNGSSESPEGVYFWVIGYEDPCGTSSQKRGSVTLLR